MGNVKVEKKHYEQTKRGVRFFINKRGALCVDRESLHQSEGYKRQIEALRKLTLSHAEQEKQECHSGKCGFHERQEVR